MLKWVANPPPPGKRQTACPGAAAQDFKKITKKNIHEYCLVSDNSEMLYDTKVTHYRFISDKFFNPNTIQLCGEYVAIQIWEPFAVIVIKHKGFSDAYRNYFQMLWNTAKKKPLSKPRRIKV